MKKIKKALFVLFALTPAVALLSGCGEETSEETSSTTQIDPDFHVDKNLIFGMDDIYWQEYSWKGISYTLEHQLFESLGVKSVRFWAHATWMLSNPTKVNEKNYQIARDSLDEIKDKGYQIIGLNHGSFKTEYIGETNSTVSSAKPPRDLSEGSKYRRWLEDYETSWYNLVNLFPEITIWEIDNETNNTDFMSRVGGGQFSKYQMAQITYDMMYYGSRGIHRANPNAVTVMGGLVVRGAENFLEDLYNMIYNVDGAGVWDSNNPDDYFQCACWHPYMSGFNKKSFINVNNSIYEVIKRREGKDKRVFLTEAGINDSNYSNNEELCAQYIVDMYEAVRDDLYYVESLHYYRMWDLEGKRYGLFTDPTQKREVGDYNIAAPKPAAFAFQKMTGATGDLHIYENYVLEHGVPPKP